MRDGASTTDIQTAYIWIVRDLRKRQTLHLKRNESVKLVRQYAKCMNEISCVYDISEEKVYRLEELRKRRVEFEMGLTAGVTMPNDQPKLSERIEERIEMIKANHKHLPRLLKDLKGSLDVLFQIRTMEQNELTLMAESNNRAILVFTIVTIIFLPLSFFTSYFGMNIRGVADTDKTERYFWTVCGVVTTFVVGLTIIFGFKERLHEWLLSWISEDVTSTEDESDVEY
ncbi:MAG: hypothetical protein OHK93_002496 [Ramalina farinacea]|uniref:Uncharacterized protein n=1 Tax=Ramalina farinacea TaxID=258253 RepID=A0AA43QSB1_9LECA|nr:hypothetical protein [Ramalina farinacea]